MYNNSLIKKICMNNNFSPLNKVVYFLFCMLIFCNCNNQNNHIEKESNLIVFPIDGIFNISNSIYNNSTASILLYYDSLTCLSCAFKDAYLWDKLLEKHQNIQLCMIFDIPATKIPEIKSAYKVTNIKHPLYIDTIRAFSKRYFDDLKILSRSKATLINEKKILYTGNPLRDPKDKKKLFNAIYKHLDSHKQNY